MIKDQEIKKIAQEFFKNLGFDVEITEIKIQDSLISVKIESQDPGVLIGKNGQTLEEIQHLLKLLIKRKTAENFYLEADVNNYKFQKIDYLKELAKDEADEVVRTRKEKSLWPMSSYERRIIHLELANRGDIVTESLGEGEERKIFIKPK